MQIITFSYMKERIDNIEGKVNNAISNDTKSIMRYTSDEIKKILASAWTTWKWYQRIWNIIISPFVALWAAVEWVVRSIVNWIKWGPNLDNTFSKNPISNTSYEHLKTENALKRNKNWFSKWRFSRKMFKNNQWEQNSKLANPITPIEKKENPNNKKPKSNTETKKEEVKGEETKKDKVENNQKSTPDTKPDIKPDNSEAKESKNNKEYPIDKTDQKNEIKEEKNEVKNGKEKANNEDDNKEKNAQSTEEQPEHIWVKQAKEILSDCSCAKTIIDKLCKSHKDFWIIFDDTTSIGRNNENNTITIWTQIPKNPRALAPFNRDTKSKTFQIKHLLLHELSHWVVHSHKDDIPEIERWLSIIKKYINDRKDIDQKTLSLLSYQSNVYKTTEAKALEDFVEMIALRMNWNWKMSEKYLNLLSKDDHKDFRENYWLATISKEDAQELQRSLDSIISFYQNT